MDANWRRTAWLLAGSLMLAGAHCYFAFRGEGTQLIARETLIAAEGPELAGVRILRAGRRTIELGCSRSGVWHLSAPYAAQADRAAVERLRDALTIEPVLRTYGDGELARFGRDREDYGLGDGALVVEVSFAGGRTRSVRLGNPTPDGRGVFAGIDGEALLYVVPAVVRAAIDRPAREFRTREFCPVVSAAVAGVDIKRSEGELVRLRRLSGDGWSATVKDTTVPASRFMAGRLIDWLSQAQVKDFVWPVGASNEPQIATAPLLALYGLDGESAVTVTLHCDDGTGRQVVFGNAAKDGRVYALTAAASAVATVDGRLKDLAGGADFTDPRCFPFVPDDVRRVSIVDGDRNFLLARRDDGSWRLDAPVVAVADAVRAGELVEDILRLTSADLAADGVEVAVNAAAPVRVGRRRLFSRFAPEELRERTILAVDPGSVRRLAVEGVQCTDPASVVFDADRREWAVESANHAGAVRTAAIAAVLETFNPLQASGVVRLCATEADLRACGLDRPAWSFAIDLADAGELRRNLLIGARTADGGYYAASGDRGTVFTLPAETVARLTAGLVERE